MKPNPHTPTRRLVLYASALFIEAALLSLAHWQYTRWQTKLALAEARAAAPTITLTGTWLTPDTSVLDNQPKPTSADAPPSGRRLLTPLQTETGTILIDRGWLPMPANRTEAPNVSTLNPTTPTVSGRWANFPTRKGWFHGPDTTTHPRILAWLNPTLITSATLAPPFALQYLEATTPTADASTGLIAQPAPILAPDKHAAYAIQWLAMALVFPALCLTLIFRKRTRRKSKAKS